MSNIISNPESIKAINKALQEMSASMTRVEAERDLIKDIVETVSEDHGIEKKIFRRMAKVYHKRNFTTEVQEHEEFEVMYENVVGGNHEPV